jgi:hypothetical protein
MRDPEASNTAAQSEATRARREQLALESAAGAGRGHKPVTLQDRFVAGAGIALVGGLMILVWAFPMLSITMPLYWVMVCSAFVSGFIFAPTILRSNR